jgi:hypothetical protein
MDPGRDARDVQSAPGGSKPTRREITTALVTAASWIALCLAITGHLGLDRFAASLSLVAAASTIATFVVSSRPLAGPRPVSAIGRFLALTVIVLVSAATAYLVFLAVALRDWRF